MEPADSSRRLLLPLLLVAGVSLLTAIWAGLFRAGWPFEPLLVHHPLAHGPLLLCGILGTVIGLEKATAMERWWAYLAPLSSAVGALCLSTIAAPSAAQFAFAAVSAMLVLVFVALLRRRADVAEVIMLSGAVA